MLLEKLENEVELEMLLKRLWSGTITQSLISYQLPLTSSNEKLRKYFQLPAARNNSEDKNNYSLANKKRKEMDFFNNFKKFLKLLSSF